MWNDLIGARIQSMPLQQSVRFGVVGDSKPDFLAYWNMVRDDVLGKQRAQFAVHVGDVTDWSKLREYRACARQMQPVNASTPLPIMHCIGNHDDRLLGWFWFRKLFGSWNFFVSIGTWTLVMVRNAYVLKYGLTKKDADFLSKELSLAKKLGKQVAMFMHVPPLEPFKDSGLPRKKLLRDDHLKDILATYDVVRLAFYGHIHAYGAANHGGIQHIITGGGAPNLQDCAENPPATRPGNHATMVTLCQDGSWKTELMMLGGEIDSRYTIEGERRKS